MGTNKLSLIGCFGMCNVPGFPFILPPFFVTVGITNLKGRLTKPKNVTVRIEDTTNSIVMANMSGQINAPPEYEFNGAEIVEMPFPILPFQIFHAGRYSVDVLIDGDKTGRRDLTVSAITAQMLPPHQQKPQ